VTGKPSRDATTVDLKGRLPFPDPVAVLSLHNCAVFRAVDDDEQPVLILTDGVTTVALECGLHGPSDEAVQRAQRLAEGVVDYSRSVSAASDRLRRR
jgi:hypothetical protein